VEINPDAINEQKPRNPIKDYGSWWLLTAACMALLLGADPLVYVIMWRFVPGNWVTAVPQDFLLTAITVGIGLLTGGIIALAAAWWLLTEKIGMLDPGFFRLYLAVLISGISIGCASGWLVYVLCWKTQ
jgi:hypothetical protein